MQKEGSLKNHRYGVASRILHQVALESVAVAEASFRLDVTFTGVEPLQGVKSRPVFVSGLARAGTTVLMREIYSSGEFRSLTYRDMPFVMAPNLWRKISDISRKSTEVMERDHADGLKVDFDSPEALEEVFWRVFAGASYIKPDRLLPMELDEELIEKYRLFVATVLHGFEGKRYLSKNNNNVLRLRSLKRAFPDAKILVPYRDPVNQAFSLFSQHTRLLRQHRKDAFSRKYMRWLVHHEFGSDHRPVASANSPSQSIDSMGFNYWLQNWVNTYAYLLDKAPPTCIWVSYDRMCSESEIVWPRLCQAIGIEHHGTREFRSASRYEVKAEISADLLEQARLIHQQLEDRAIETLLHNPGDSD